MDTDFRKKWEESEKDKLLLELELNINLAGGTVTKDNLLDMKLSEILNLLYPNNIRLSVKFLKE